MCKVTPAAVATTTLTKPRTQRPLVEHVRRPELLLSMSVGALGVLTAACIEGFAEPGLPQIGSALKFHGVVRKGAVLFELADPLQVVDTVLRLPQVPLQGNARGAVVPGRLRIRLARTV